MRLKPWHWLAFLFLAVLLAYYPTLSAGYNSVDDLKMISRLDQAGPLNLRQLFLPGGTAYYYRPLTILSYLLDRDLWGMIASFMHLHNILLHFACSLMVFFVSRQLVALYPEREKEAVGTALIAALFFALHPLGTESVCWISGRTDLLMTLFLLLAVYLVMVSLATNRSAVVLGAGVALVLAGLAKEVAVFILPGLLWLIIVYPSRKSLLRRMQQRWRPLLLTTASIGVYFLLRYLAVARDTGIRTALKGVPGGDFDLLNNVRITFKVYGFYFKKLLIPWPLNFGIVEVSGWYVLSGIVLAVILFCLLRRMDVPGAFGLMAFCVLSPALIVVFGKMTWTPLAERYLYASVAFSAPLAAWFVQSQWARFAGASRRRFSLGLTLLLLVFFGTVLQRSWVWQDNLRLYRDTAAKSPGFVAVQTELASALLRRGETAEAEKILRGIGREDSGSGYINDDLNLAAILLNEGDPDGARNRLLPLLDKKPKRYFELLQSLIRINDQRLGRVATVEAKTAIHRENLSWLLEQQLIKPRVFTLYRIGKRYLALGERDKALEFFKKAYAGAPRDAYYRGAAATFIRRLENHEI
ncbi:hypothetical protein C2E25_13770 [Geothermobacter hydrogeniphilus]|uniref:Uncharacterized protein n=1 Tax=Geothermobacter hydrogeniphilus TaxID=1969733 RepID=A0A2K2H7C8_9BACT|nr:tetratricopeptide repeat protein [Geothermobacter hydrogeniphilus]PNU19208.1 hypothetical protein C2E25_13770 [Geothermobacter hydrogeniphilus]